MGSVQDRRSPKSASCESHLVSHTDTGLIGEINLNVLCQSTDTVEPGRTNEKSIVKRVSLFISRQILCDLSLFSHLLRFCVSSRWDLWCEGCHNGLRIFLLFHLSLLAYNRTISSLTIHTNRQRDDDENYQRRVSAPRFGASLCTATDKGGTILHPSQRSDELQVDDDARRTGTRGAY